MKQRDLIKVVEACYSTDEGPLAWLEGVHAALSPIVDTGLGTCMYRYDFSSSGIRAYEMVERNAAVDVEAMKSVLTSVTDEYVEGFETSPCGMAHEVPGFEVQPSMAEFFRPAGVEDIIAINAFDPAGDGIMFGAFCGKRATLPSKTRAAYNRLSAHIAAGLRLRRRLESDTSDGTAVMTPGGRVMHAEGSATLASARTALADAVRAVDRARGRERKSDPEGAVEHWRALVSARWSLVDQFERDGKRYVVAKMNSPRAPDLPDLPTRERQVLAFAALGHHNKLIAYALGLAASTVRVLFMRAARRLGTRTRRETVAAFVKLTRPSPP